MTKLNKVGSNLEQDFNETEKAQARANIGAVAIKNQFLITGSHTVTSDESSRGYFSFTYSIPTNSKGKIWLEDFRASMNGTQEKSLIPLRVRHEKTKNDDTIVSDTWDTGVFFKKLNSYYYGQSFVIGMRDVKSIEYVVEFDSEDIAENTVINYEIDVSVLN